MAEFEFWVDGMTCEHCERAITAELTSLPGVLDAQADAETGRVNGTHQDALNRSDVEKALEEAGFPLRSWPSP